MESRTQMYECTTITLAQKEPGLFRSRQIAEFGATLNREARLRWSLCRLMTPSACEGESDNVTLLSERESRPEQRSISQGGAAQPQNGPGSLLWRPTESLLAPNNVPEG